MGAGSYTILLFLQASRDMRDEAHYEKNVHKIGGGYGSGHSVGHRGEHENYEITRSRFDPHHQTFHSTSGRSLSDRWQTADVRKDGAPLDRVRTIIVGFFFSILNSVK